jgi:hypothetical protein
MKNIKLIFYHVEWCHVCRDFKHDWDTIVDHLKKENIHTEKIDYENINEDDDVNADILKNLVVSYPTLIIVEEDDDTKKFTNVEKFEGQERTVNNVIDFALKYAREHGKRDKESTEHQHGGKYQYKYKKYKHKVSKLVNKLSH